MATVLIPDPEPVYNASLSSEKRTVSNFLPWARACSAAATAFGLIGLLAWVTDIPFLAQLHKNSVLMAPRTAVAYIILGTGLFFYLRLQESLFIRILLFLSGASALFLSLTNNKEIPMLTNLIEPILLQNLNIWEFMYRDRMEPLLGYTVMLLGPCAMLIPFIGRHNSVLRSVVGSISLLVVGVHSVLLLAFFYGVPLSFPEGDKPPSFPSAAASMLMGMALISTMGPRHFPLNIFAGPSTRARLMRTFMPVGMISVILYGVLTRTVFGPLNPAFSSFLGTMISAGIISLLVLRTAHIVSRQIERSLRESNERFSILISSTKDYSMIMLDPLGHVVTWNSGAERFSGYRGEEIIGEHFSCFYLPQDVSAGQPDVDLRQAHARGSYEKQAWRLRKDGSPYWAEVTLTAVYGDEGQLRGFSEVTRDITERRGAEQELQQKTSFLEMLQVISAAANEAFKVEEAFQITLKEVCRVTGWPVGHALTVSPDSGELVPSVFFAEHPEHYRRFAEKTAAMRWVSGTGLPGRVLAEGKAVCMADLQRESSFRRPEAAAAVGIQSGCAFPVFLGNEIVAVLEFFSKAKTYPDPAFLNVMTHVGYQLGQVVERQRVEEKTTGSLREKEVLLKEIHHRVKNNLQIITSLLRLQSEMVEDERVLEMFRESQGRVQSMALVHEHLYKSDDMASIRFKDYVQNITASLFRSFGIRPERIQLHLDIDESSLNLNTAIPCGLIVTELITNVLKHAFPRDRNGNLWIRFRTLPGDQAEMVVKDDGVGLSKPVDFQNAESLGVRLIYLLTKQLNGAIDLRMENGTEFRIHFRMKS